VRSFHIFGCRRPPATDGKKPFNLRDEFVELFWSKIVLDFGKSDQLNGLDVCYNQHFPLLLLILLVGSVLSPISIHGTVLFILAKHTFGDQT
jgi:hypothetical protein